MVPFEARGTLVPVPCTGTDTAHTPSPPILPETRILPDPELRSRAARWGSAAGPLGEDCGRFGLRG